VSRWSEFEGADVGIGGRFTWKPTTLLGVEADLTWYPAEFPPDSVAFSGQRIDRPDAPHGGATNPAATFGREALLLELRGRISRLRLIRTRRKTC